MTKGGGSSGATAADQGRGEATHTTHWAIRQGLRNHAKDAIGIFRDIIIGEPQHRVAFGRKERVASRVSLWRVADIVRVPIYLDDQASMVTGEVDVKRADLFLPAEMKIAGSERMQQSP